MKAPVIAIVGRTNVGKSTLFNVLAEASKALVSAIPGTTRDRSEADCFWQGLIARVVDTGGIDLKGTDVFDRDIREQAELAIDTADLILLVVDTKTGPTPDDRALAKRLRDSRKAVMLLTNKADNAPLRKKAIGEEWKALGLGQPLAIAANQGSGVGDVLDLAWTTLKKIDKPPVEVSDVTPTRLMVIGTPNVGKSTLLNALVGSKRFITSTVAHTTREPNDTKIEVAGKTYILIDTAGIRKLSGVRKRGGMELAGVMKTIHLLPQCDVALLVIDVSAEIGVQEKKLIEKIVESNVGIVIVANKWDLAKNKTSTTQNEYLSYLAKMLPFIPWAPVVFTSALSGAKVEKVLEAASHVHDERYRLIDEEEVWAFMKSIMKQHQPSRGKGVKHPVILRLRQIKVAPPTFSLTVKGQRADSLHPSYLRFIENRLREKYGFDGSPIVILAKAERRFA
ncbi:MAG: ribosome biogenesis GTPase Der [Patescibacteria group bacterium]